MNTTSHRGIGPASLFLRRSDRPSSLRLYIYIVLILLCSAPASVFATPTADFTASLQIACTGQSVLFTDASVGTILTYSWNFGTDATPATATTAGPHLVSYSTSGQKSITLTVTAADGSNTITKTNFVLVTSSAPSLSAIFGSSSVCANASGINFSVTPASDASSYSWTVPSGASISSGQNSPSVNVSFGTTGGNVCVTASNGCGTSAAECKSVQVGKDQIILMNYNLLNYPDQGTVTIDTTVRNPYYRTIVSAVNPDIFVTQENTGANTVTGILNYVLNPAIGGYAAATFINGFDSDNSLYYKTSKFSFVSNTPIITDLRDINEFKLVHLLSGDTIRIFSVHLKASNTPADEAQRALEVDSLRKYTNALPAGSNFLVCGDYNIYKSSESCYQKLLAVTPGSDGNFNDAITTMTGTWNNGAYAQYHTQSTRTRAFGGGATGGVDDRFDLILFSNAMMQSGGITYFPNSMYPLGNDGNHYGDSINKQPNTAVSIAVANALHGASDHLPVVATIEFQNASCPNADLGVTALIDPVNPSCSSPNQNMQVQVKNYGTNSVNFAVNNLQVNLQVTLPSSTIQAFSSTLTSGILGPGATTLVSFPATLNMSASGAYVFNATSLFSGDTIPSNNAMNPVTIQIYPNTASSITPASSTTFCSGGSVVLNADQTSNVSYQWQLNGIDIVGAIASSYNATASGSYQLQLQKINSVLVSSPATTFTNNSVFSIPNNSCTGASSTISVSGYQGAVTSSGITIKININHTAVGDLVLFLEAPNGSRLGLSNRTGNTGNTGNNFTNTIFSDAGATSIPTSGTPYTGTYKPWPTTFTSCVSSTLTSFGAIGGGTINPNGNWKLLVYDRASGNTGTIQNWSITFPAYSVTTSLVCDPVISSGVDVLVNPNPTISYSPFVPVICSSTGITVTASGASSYSWAPAGGLSATTGAVVFANPIVATTYTITGTDINGCVGSTLLPITLHSTPIVTLNPFATVCQSSPAFSLTGGSPAGGVYSGPGVSGGSFSPTTAGVGTHTLSYTYTDGNGCSAVATSTINVNANPTANIFPSGTLSLCSGSSLTLSAPSGYSYQWSTGASSSFILVSSPGSYSVTVSDANGCSSSSSPVVVTANANPLIVPLFIETMGTPGGNTAISTYEAANGFDNVALTMSGSADVRTSTASIGYAWASGSGNVFITNVVGRNFIISGINTVGLTNLQLQFGIAKSTTASNGSELQVLVSDNGGPYTQLAFTALPTGAGTTAWTTRLITSGIPNSSNLSIQFLQTGVTPQFRIDDVMILYTNPSPTISSSGSANLCQGNSVTLTSAPALSYLWDNGSTTRSITVNNSSAHSCLVTGFTGCVASTNGILVTAKPTLFTTTGGGNYCSGGSGVVIGLDGSETGVVYQLKLGGINTGSPLNGSGAALSFGLKTTAGNYTVLATETSSGCTATMTGSSSVTINPAPQQFTVTGGAAICSGSSGTAIGLSGSSTGISYQLFLNGNLSGSPISGTGSALNFGSTVTNGNYTVVATDVSTSCTASMIGQATVSTLTSPTAFVLSGSGNYCPGASGIPVILSGSQTSTTYQLFNGSTAVGSSIAGTGLSISFGDQTGPATFNVIATATNGCTTMMTGTASVNPFPAPLIFTVTGGGSYCTVPGDGVPIGLTHSEIGVEYQLYESSSPTGSPLNGANQSISFGNQTAVGNYTVVATRISNGCTLTMNGSVSVSQLVLSNWFADADNDGYGDPNTMITDCSQPPGYISDQSDCNDQNIDVNPGATEICGNSIDDNCDGQTDENCGVNLSITVFLQGFYRGAGLMLAVADPVGSPTLCDTITVELASSAGLHPILFSVQTLLSTSGQSTAVFPQTVLGGNFYIVIRHRNSVAIWSSTPISINTNSVAIDFSISSATVFGGNVHVEADGMLSMYSGDVDQNGFVDTTDLLVLENSLNDFIVGYRSTDLTGDYFVESADYSLVENNSGIQIIRP